MTDKNEIISEVSKLHSLGKYSEAEILLENLIIKYPEDSQLKINLAVIYRALEKSKEAKDILHKLLEFEPNNAYANNNLANLHNQENLYQESIKYYKKAFEINPSMENIHNNLGGILYKIGEFEEALAVFKDPQQNIKPDVYILQCLLALGKYDDFWSNIKKLSTGKPNVGIASISAYASEKLEVEDIYPFCRNSLDCVYKAKANLFDARILGLLKDTKNAISQKNLDSRRQSLITNGKQTAGNFFERKDKLGYDLLVFLTNILDDYKNYLPQEDDIISHWPKDPKFNGWGIFLNNTGFLAAHNHIKGWVSGAIYLQIPDNIKQGEAAISFSYDGPEYPKINDKKLKQKLVGLETGDIVIFPSSLFHNTLPFESEEDRICFAFDVNP